MKPILLVAAIFTTLAPGPVWGQLVHGIDVSHWQGAIDWTAVKNSGIDFAFAKATDGAGVVDPKFIQNATGASGAGVYIGPYHFGRLNTDVADPLDAVNEANAFVDAIEPFYQSPARMLRPVIDVQNSPGFYPISLAVERAYVSQWVRDFSSVVETRLGVSPIIYADVVYAKFYLEADLAQYPLWLAARTAAPPNFPPPTAAGVFGQWTIWQYSETGAVPGIVGAVDLNVYRGTLPEFLAEVQAVPIPEPTAWALGTTSLGVLAARRRGSAISLRPDRRAKPPRCLA